MKILLEKNKLLILVTVVLCGLSSAATVSVSIILQNIINTAMDKDTLAFKQILILSVIYFICFGLISYLYNYSSKALIRNVTQTLRNKVFKGIFKKNHQSFNENNTADYISSLTNDIKLIEENYMVPVLLIIQSSATFLITLVILSYMSIVVTAFLFVFTFVLLLVPSLFGKALEKRQSLFSKQSSIFTTKIKDFFSGYEVIKSYGIDEAVKSQYTEENNKLTLSKFSIDKLIALNDSISEILSNIIVFAVVFIASYLIIIGNITMGTMIALVQLSSLFIHPIIVIISNVAKVKSSKMVLRRMIDLSKEDEHMLKSEQKPPTFYNQIRMNHLSFSYNDEQKIQDDINFTFEKNKKYAIVGESGCGKTTLIKLLLGYFTEYKGEIMYDNTNLKQIDSSLVCKMASVIHQDIFLFDTDIKQNICLYKNFPDKELNDVLSFSGVDKFLRNTDAGIFSTVGENGINFSGGQRQRVAVARAFIQKTPILILDEGTSAIDKQTAYDIESQLLTLDDLTLISITHNLNAELLSLYDQIIYMDKGRIIETGSLEELISKNRRFKQFFMYDNKKKVSFEGCPTEKIAN